LTPISIDMC